MKFIDWIVLMWTSGAVFLGILIGYLGALIVCA